MDADSTPTPAVDQTIRDIYGEPEDEITSYRGLELDPFQQNAIEALRQGNSLLVSAPTGAGKTLIAEYALEKCIQANRDIIYTAPIKALSNQKFRDFSSTYGDRVGIMTGDVTINPEACALIMTTEVFRNTIFESPERLRNVHYCIFDEIHYMDDPARGTVWEESIIYAPQHIRFISLSATISNLSGLAEWMNEIRDTRTEVIECDERPVPLKHHPYLPKKQFCTMEELERLYHSRSRKQARSIGPGERIKWEKKLVDIMEDRNHLPALYFVFSRRGCREKARRNSDRDLLTKAESERAVDIFETAVENFGITYSSNLELLRKTVPRGIAYHHAGLLPSLKEIIERLFTEGLINLLYCTETFALGINMPARSVVFESLQKFDGTQVTYIKSREFAQMAGRAGRRGIDEVGHVYPVIDWPDYDLNAVRDVIEGEIEPIRSKFGLQYSTILNLYRSLRERIIEACKNSFIHYQSTHEDEDQSKRDYELRIDQIKKKLQFLKEFNYINDQELTRKGEFASRVNGYEIQAAEFLASDLLSKLSETELILVLAAAVFEPRGNRNYPGIHDPEFRQVAREADNLIKAVNVRENELGIKKLTKKPDFSLTGLVYDWGRGRPFHQLSRDTEAAEGDLVRTLRMTVQLCRMIYRNLEQDLMLKRRLMQCVERINRGVVDAEKQLNTRI